MTDSQLQPEVWLRGPVPGVPAALQPVAHALLQAVEEAEGAAADLDTAELWMDPGGAATVGFHLRHMAQSLDRLLTYARGESLSEAQRARLTVEKRRAPDVGVMDLLAELRRVTERAIAQLRATLEEELDEPRPVGRAGLPSSVRGLLHHAGEHTARHAGQVITTVKVLRGRRAGDGRGGGR